MSVITFSRMFPGYHPRKGEPTNFVEKILNQRMGSHWKYPMYLQELADLNPKKPFSLIEEFYYSLDFSITDKKGHTIRAGHRWEAGQNFSPRVWSGKPYRSPQIIFAPDQEVKKEFYFEIFSRDGGLLPTREYFLKIGDRIIELPDDILSTIANNDGLSLKDFKDWLKFPEPFQGQIICWDENI